MPWLLLPRHLPFTKNKHSSFSYLLKTTDYRLQTWKTIRNSAINQKPTSRWFSRISSHLRASSVPPARLLLPFALVVELVLSLDRLDRAISPRYVILFKRPQILDIIERPANLYFNFQRRMEFATPSRASPGDLLSSMSLWIKEYLTSTRSTLPLSVARLGSKKCRDNWLYSD